MIRTVAREVICLAGLGAIAAAAKKSPPPPPEVVMPVVAGNKADRLPLIVNPDTPTDAEKVDIVYVPPSIKAKPICLHRHHRSELAHRIRKSFVGVGMIYII
jgi:hypothetical protein